MINWRVRIKNKVFWIAIIPALVLLVRLVAHMLGFDLESATVHDDLIAILDAVFAVLAIMGIVVDPTTEGIEDSTLAKTYKVPKKRESDECW